MNITSAQYIAWDDENQLIEVVIDGERMKVPLDSANRHYAEILEQVAAGTLTIADAE